MAFAQERRHRDMAWQADPAEREADRLSEGVTASSPQQVRSEMGNRLGADFSGVRFHTGSSAAAHAGAENARAYTSGNDIYFGEGGFAPDVAAHELVHTVQQGAVAGNANESVPFGTVQRVPPGGNQGNRAQANQQQGNQGNQAANNELDGFEIIGNQGPQNARERLGRSFIPKYGFRLYKKVEDSLKNLARKAGVEHTKPFTGGERLDFLCKAASKDAGLATDVENLSQLIWQNQPRNDRDVAARAATIKAFIDNVSQQLPRPLLEKAASETGLFRNMRERVQRVSNKGNDSTRRIIHMLSTKFGYGAFRGFEQPLRDLAKKAGVKDANKLLVRELIVFLDRISKLDRHYAEDYELISNETCDNEDEQRKQTMEFKALVSNISQSTKKEGLKAAAIDAGLIQGTQMIDPRNHDQYVGNTHKRAYEITGKDLNEDRFNPSKSAKVAKVQWDIDQARTATEAWQVFARFSGNNASELKNKSGRVGWQVDGVDLTLFKNKMKNMARMVFDYPHLQGKIGNLEEVDHIAEKDTSMYATRKPGAQRSDIGYNAYMDRSGPDGERERRQTAEWEAENHYSIATPDYDGTHELGHVLNNLIAEWYVGDLNYRITANNMIQEILAGNKRLRKQAGTITRFASTEKDHKTGQIDLEGSDFFEKNLTSGYGSSNAAEFFAEAHADVYEHGVNAKPMSIAFVKLTEQKLREWRRRHP